MKEIIKPSLFLIILGLLVLGFKQYNNKTQEKESIYSNIELKDWRKISETKTIPENNKFFLLNFWADFCAPCIHEIPLLMKNYRKLKQNQIELWGVHTGKIKEKWMKKRFPNINYPIHEDRGKLGRLFKIHFLPVTYLIDDKGQMLRLYKGVLDQKTIDSFIETAKAQ